MQANQAWANRIRGTGPVLATTALCTYSTGHAGANELLSFGKGPRRDNCRYRKADQEEAHVMLQWAEPDAAWCEIYNAGKLNGPIEIYGRINRIRPWESSINYAALLDWLSWCNPGRQRFEDQYRF